MISNLLQERHIYVDDSRHRTLICRKSLLCDVSLHRQPLTLIIIYFEVKRSHWSISSKDPLFVERNSALLIPN